MERDEGRNTVYSYWKDLYSRLDALLKDGKHNEVQKALGVLDPRKTPKDWAVNFGELGYRALAPMFTLKVLHRFVYPENPLAEQASDKEKMIYATALFRLGAVSGAKKILDGLDAEKEPEVLFYGAIAHFYEWNYAASIPKLKEYIMCSATPAYRRLVGKVNLLAAYVNVEDFEAAQLLVSEIQKECLEKNYSLLLGNSFELKAQAEFFQQHYVQAMESINQASKLLLGHGGLYSLFVEKWAVICKLFMLGESRELNSIADLKARFLKENQWESIRELDLFEAVATRNEDLFERVVMGTPLEFYRQRARRLYGDKLKYIGEFTWYMGEPSQKNNTFKKFDPYKSTLVEKPLLLSLFDALTQDFYKPANLGFLFQCIYPNEKFNPFSSVPRILQLLRRLANWFTENNICLKVKFKKSEFSIESTENIFIVIKRGQQVSSYEAKFLRLKEKFFGRGFTAVQASEALGVSKATSQRFLGEALEKGKLVRIGQGRGIQYRFPSRKTKKVAA